MPAELSPVSLVNDRMGPKPTPIVPHFGIAEVSRRRGGSETVRLLGADEAWLYLHRDHIDYLKEDLFPFREQWEKGPTEGSEEIPGQIRARRTPDMTVRMYNELEKQAVNKQV